MRRSFGLLATLIFVGSCSHFSDKKPPDGPPVTVVQSQWTAVDRVVPNVPRPTVVWSGDPLVHPRGVMLSPEGDALYVTDPGEPARDPINKPARIVKFQVRNGVPTAPRVFFSRPGFMISAKWGFPITVQGARQVLVADQGEESQDNTYSGRGAKVFTIPLLNDGSAGEPRVLWHGKPFVCPTGIAAVGQTIYVTDPCAGPVRTRPERPDRPFPSSAIFGLRLTGGEAPRLLKSGAPFTSLIGICILTPGEIIVNDTDSGRIDPAGSGGRPGFAPPGMADRWVLKILDKEGFKLSDPIRTPLLQEGLLTLQFPASVVATGSRQNDVIRIRADDGARIVPIRSTPKDAAHVISPRAAVTEVELDAQRLREQAGRVTMNVESDVLNEVVKLMIRIPGRREFAVDVPRAFPGTGPFDNKHGGAKKDKLRVRAESESFLRFTTDNALGHGAVYIYRGDGGPFATLYRGDPLQRPVSGQLSADGATLWIVDQAKGALFSLPFPSSETFRELFPLT